MFKKLLGPMLGGLLGSLDVERLAKEGITQATSAMIEKPLTETFVRMRAKGRAEMADNLETAAKALREGRCKDAALEIGDVIEGIKL